MKSCAMLQSRMEQIYEVDEVDFNFYLQFLCSYIDDEM